MKGKVLALVVAIVVVASGVSIWLVTRHRNGQPANKNGQSAQQNTAAPVIHLDVPQDTLLLSQDKKSFQVAIKTDDYNKIARVEYLIDGNFTVYSTRPPFTVDIDISSLSAGQHTIQAVAYSISGKVSKSDVFAFIISESQAVEPANDTAKTVVRDSSSIASLNKIVTSSTPSSGSNNSGSSGGGNNNGGNNGGGNDTTPWPDTPIAEVCGDTALLSGPTSAPAGATVVPAGDNSGVDFEVAGRTYWFAPGTHKLTSASFAQIQPKNNATYVGGPGAILDGQGTNQYAFTGHATGVKIQYLTITGFVAPRDEGVVNHDSGVGWAMEYNTLYNNKGGAMFAGTNNVVRYNCLRDNGQYGFQVYSSDPGGPTNVLLDHNEISGNNTDDWESQITGCGCTGGGKFWEAHNVTVTNNYVHDNLSVGLWADTNDTDFLVDGNYIANNESQGLFYEISYNMIVRNNNFIGNSVSTGPTNNSFPAGAIYLSESGGDSRVTGGRTTQIEIYDNNFQDNWAGIILWENADRFCNSPANTSSGTCTMVNPAATLTTCNDPGLGGSINVEPYKSDCRWKTQNVKIHDNVFSVTRSNIAGCDDSSSCAYQGIFSNVGTFPSWSPYMGSGIQHAITYDQGNLFSNNTYIGDWRFKAETQNSNYNFAIWQGSPYGQDAGSTYNGKDHLSVANAIDTDTSTLEGSIGEWSSWFSSSVSRSTAEAHTGTHSLKVDITAPFGWGVQLNDPTGYPITPQEKTISFWTKLGAGTNLTPRIQVQWLDQNQNLTGPNTEITSPVLTSSWQKSSTVVTPPAGTRTANIVFLGGNGTTGNSFYLDDIIISDNN